MGGEASKDEGDAGGGVGPWKGSRSECRVEAAGTV